MDRRRARQGRDPLCRFYSADAVGRLVAEAVSDRDPRTIVDLGSGSGVLACAASLRWPSAHVTTVDIDPDAEAARTFQRGGRRHLLADVLDPDFAITAELADADAVLSNPPFGPAQTSSDRGNMLAAAGLPAASPCSLELLFAAQALRIARDGGSVVLVVSDGFATGRRGGSARRALLAAHRVVSATQVPTGSFRGTEAGGFILSLVKGGGPTDRVLLRRAAADGTLLSEMQVSSPAACERFDLGFHETMHIGRKEPTLRELGATVVRGSFDLGSAAIARETVFHTTDFPRAPLQSIEIPQRPAPRPHGRIVVAEAGDVLVARLGRGLERKVCLIAGGWTAPSSAVLRIRLPAGEGARVAEALLSPLGASRLSATSRGTGARMLGREDLLAMPLPM